jgi:hypothetical protein
MLKCWLTALYTQEVSWYSFLLEAESILGPGSIRLFEISNDLIANQSHDIPACRTVPQATILLLIFILFLLV